MTTETKISPLEHILLDTLESTSSGIGKAIDFAAEQIPDVIHQLLMWKFVGSLILFSFSLILSIISFYLAYKLFEGKKGTKFYDMEPFGIFPFLFGLGFSLILFHNLDWIKIWVAPKLYLLEYATELVKKVN